MQAKKRATAEELDDARERQSDLTAQIDRCRNLLDVSRAWTGFAPAPFRDALSCSLELLDAPPLAEGRDEAGRKAWTFPPLDRPRRHGSELDGDPGHAPRAAPDRSEARRLAPRRAHPAGGLRGCRRAERGHRPSPPGAAARSAAAGTVPGAGVRLSRPVTGLPRAGEGLHPPRDSARPPLPVRPAGGTPARGAGAGRRAVDRPGATPVAAPRLRPRSGNALRWCCSTRRSGGREGRTRSSGAGCWPLRPATSSSFAPSSNRAPPNLRRPRNGVWPSGENARVGTCTRRCSASAGAWSRSSTDAKRTTSSSHWPSRKGEMRQLDADMRHWRWRLDTVRARPGTRAGAHPGVL